MEHIYEREEFGENWFTYPNLYKQVVNRLSTGSTFVEVGSWKGKSIAFFVVEAVNSGKTIECYSVDTWEGSSEHADYDILKNDGLFNLFKSNIEPIQEHIKYIRKPSLLAAEDFADDSIDSVFIDAAHDYDNVKADIQAWIPKVKSGGLIMGHDYLSSGVKKAVDEYFGNAVLFNDAMENCWIVEIQ